MIFNSSDLNYKRIHCPGNLSILMKIDEYQYEIDVREIDSLDFFFQFTDRNYDFFYFFSFQSGPRLR